MFMHVATNVKNSRNNKQIYHHYTHESILHTQLGGSDKAINISIFKIKAFLTILCDILPVLEPVDMSGGFALVENNRQFDDTAHFHLLVFQWCDKFWCDTFLVSHLVNGLRCKMCINAFVVSNTFVMDSILICPAEFLLNSNC